MTLLAIAGLCWLVGMTGLLTQARHQRALRARQPGAFQRGLVVARGRVVGPSVSAPRTEGAARSVMYGSLDHNTIFFVRRTVPAVCPVYSAGQIILGSTHADYELRLGWGWLAFHLGMAGFLLSATVLVRPGVAAPLGVFAGLAAAFSALVARERGYARRATTEVLTQCETAA